ncbi:MAG: HigA family addiction module antitoxin [Dehalococcoidia bacterium]
MEIEKHDLRNGSEDLVFNPEETNYLAPPGEMLAEELQERAITQSQLARMMNRPLTTVNAIIAGRKAITPDTALDLQAALDIKAEFWLNMEASFQLAKARQRRSKIAS